MEQRPFARPVSEILDELSDELTRWYAHPAQSNIPEKEQGCAFELLMVADPLGLRGEQRVWLRDYCHRWDETACP